MQQWMIYHDCIADFTETMGLDDSWMPLGKDPVLSENEKVELEIERVQLRNAGIPSSSEVIFVYSILI